MTSAQQLAIVGLRETTGSPSRPRRAQGVQSYQKMSNSPSLARLSLQEDDLDANASVVSTPNEELDDFVDADASLADHETSLKPPSFNGVEHSPRSSSASDATHSGASAETSITADSFDMVGQAKRASVSSQRSTSTIEEVPLDEVSLDDQPAPSPRRSTASSAHTDVPPQTFAPVASTSTAMSPPPPRSANRHSFPLSPVSLSASSFVDDKLDGASVNGTVGTSRLAQRRTIGSVASTSSGNNNFDFLLQVRSRYHMVCKY